MHALSGGSAAASNRAVKAHDGGHHAIDLLGGFFFVGFDVPGRVGADEDVVHLTFRHRCIPEQTGNTDRNLGIKIPGRGCRGASCRVVETYRGSSSGLEPIITAANP